MYHTPHRVLDDVLPGIDRDPHKTTTAPPSFLLLNNADVDTIKELYSAM